MRMCLGSIANHIQQLHDSEYVGPIHQSTLLMKYTVGLLLKMVFFQWSVQAQFIMTTTFNTVIVTGFVFGMGAGCGLFLYLISTATVQYSSLPVAFKLALGLLLVHMELLSFWNNTFSKNTKF